MKIEAEFYKFSSEAMIDVKIKAAAIIILKQIFDNRDNTTYRFSSKNIQALFQHYKKFSEYEQLKEWMDNLLVLHKKYCESTKNNVCLRQHNTFVLKFVANLNDKKLAREQNINSRTVYKDVKAVIDRLAILAFGIDGLNLAKQSEA